MEEGKKREEKITLQTVLLVRILTALGSTKVTAVVEEREKLISAVVLLLS